MPLLLDRGIRTPDRWRAPHITAEAWASGGSSTEYSVVFSAVPDPGLLTLEDIGGASAAGAQPINLANALLEFDPIDIPGHRSALLVDNGGTCCSLADEMIEQDKLGAFHGFARNPIPDSVLRAGVPIYQWFDGDEIDCADKIPNGTWACAFVPVGLPDDDIPTATARLLAVRDRGYGAVIPRFFVPVPNSMAWDSLESLVERRPASTLDGLDLPFALPGFGSATGSELIDIWTRENAYLGGQLASIRH